jgi:hypothetical protein
VSLTIDWYYYYSLSVFYINMMKLKSIREFYILALKGAALTSVFFTLNTRKEEKGTFILRLFVAIAKFSSHSYSVNGTFI